MHNPHVGVRVNPYVKFLKKCAERAGMNYLEDFAAEVRKRSGMTQDSRHLIRVLQGKKPPTIQILEAAASLAGTSLQQCLHLPTEFGEMPDMFPVDWEKEAYYRLLTGIFRNNEDYWVRSIQGNLYAMYMVTGKKLPQRVPPPPLEMSSGKNDGLEAAADSSPPGKLPGESHR